MSKGWDELTEEQRDAVRELLEDNIQMMAGWGLPYDLAKIGMTEETWREALDAALRALAPLQTLMDELQARLDRIGSEGMRDE